MDNLTILHWAIREFKPTYIESSDILGRKTGAKVKGAMVVEGNRAGKNNESIIYHQEHRKKRA